MWEKELQQWQDEGDRTGAYKGTHPSQTGFGHSGVACRHNVECTQFLHLFVGELVM